ncbi:putative Streptothricin hydrolase [Streptomyces afghaniensis 772]|uniref:Putative Streptothricin hydrolase n=1 Tax=Streptomyces afghaniensis 772 TaxID=1283301 RepID=S4MT71_9ACTN|nr:isochorismatase family protein [Streptomyces afghaniensis]EPJ36807.1 putative Streptothricin hydrolase [Streptomyces afghaniensis 772]
MTTALVLVDLQVGLLTGEDAVPEADSLLDRLRPLAEKARALGVPVVHVQDDDLGDVDSEEWQIDPRLGVEEGDLKVRKVECDAFHETRLDELLRSHGIRHLVVAGLVTELCIDSTCRKAVTLGYDVTLVSDGHSTPAKHLPLEAIIDHHHRILDGYGVYVERRPYEIRLQTAAEVDFVAPEEPELQGADMP